MESVSYLSPLTATALPVPASLRAAAQSASGKGQVLVLMVTLKGCVHCDVVRNGYLAPMARQGAPVVQIDMLDRAQAVQDFSGTTTTHAELARRLKIRVAPTLLFVDAEGRELAERLEGVAVPDFYGAYLEQRLEAAREGLTSGRRTPS